eukprot:352996-Amphidinium_carterae.1
MLALVKGTAQTPVRTMKHPMGEGSVSTTVSTSVYGSPSSSRNMQCQATLSPRSELQLKKAK